MTLLNHSLDASGYPSLLRTCMSNIDDFRFSSHHLLIELDAATNRLMMLVVAKEVAGPRWAEAIERQKQAYDAWAALLYQSEKKPLTEMLE
ncbi:hypothetical protein HDC30_005092 [Pseudomonas sp. JAI115]|uniref:hypothetical protein n=1 Tax=Pseudomonas sp. JAI115 TaxID=2723061 RepID=UPI0017926BF8|nr:hypothetical protein [Pseudomonas sp. JAI115]MBB6157840.1 hypothetical protein [Pseudomonas sp. JAI115]